MESGGFVLGLDFKIETATCELSPEDICSFIDKGGSGSWNERVDNIKLLFVLENF